MLQNEITPFADHHRSELRKVKNFIKDLELLLPPDASREQVDTIQEMLFRLDAAQAAFNRFDVCMHDEWRQKENYRKAALDCRLNHK